MTKLLDAMGSLEPRSFEHLAYDLLVRKGLVNARWRTPGADGGRDIEGSWPIVDFSGEVYLERWYVECKRYSKALDWPTVYAKLAYASNHEADYLLICTNSVLSPQCKTEAARHNALKRRPIVRAWEGPDLDRLLSHDSLLLEKYGLVETSSTILSSALSPLLWIASKATQDAYGMAVLETDAPAALEFAAATSELAAAKAVAGLASTAGPSRSFSINRDLYAWCDSEGEALRDRWDSQGLRAFLCAVRTMARTERLSLRFLSLQGDAAVAEVRPFAGPVSVAAREAFDAVSLVSDFEWRASDGAITLRSRYCDA